MILNVAAKTIPERLARLDDQQELGNQIGYSRVPALLLTSSPGPSPLFKMAGTRVGAASTFSYRVSSGDQKIGIYFMGVVYMR